MTENQTDGNAAVAGQEGTPPPASSAQPQQPFDGDVNALFSKLTEQMEGRFTALEKGFSDKLGRVQGTVDRSQNEFRKWMGEVEKLEKTGLSRDDAIATLETRQQADQWRVNMEKQLGEITTMLRSGGTTGGMGQVITEVLNEYKLDPKDAYVAAQMQGKTFASRTDAELFAARVFRDKQLSPNPTQAQGATQPGSGSVSGRKPEEVYAEYEQAFKNPTQNAELIVRLEEEMKGLG